MVEQGIEPGTSWLVVRSSDHQATRLVMTAHVRIAICGYCSDVILFCSSGRGHLKFVVMQGMKEGNESTH